jgi:hypothetical protein
MALFLHKTPIRTKIQNKVDFKSTYFRNNAFRSGATMGRNQNTLLGGEKGPEVGRAIAKSLEKRVSRPRPLPRSGGGGVWPGAAAGAVVRGAHLASRRAGDAYAAAATDKLANAAGRASFGGRPPPALPTRAGSFEVLDPRRPMNSPAAAPLAR